LPLLTSSQRAAIHAKRQTIMKPDSDFIRDVWRTIDKDCVIRAPDQASARIIGERLAAVVNKRSDYKIKRRAQIAKKKKEGLKPIVKQGRIKGRTQRLDSEMNDDILFGSP
jgi:hypothetical protein